MGQDGEGSLAVLVDGNSYHEVCSGTFTDRGINNNYRNNENYNVTICPQNHDLNRPVIVSFTSFNVEQGFDFLEIFDESRSQAVPDGSQPPSSRSIGKFTGNNSPGTIRSTRGCLTFRFTSDHIETRSGWTARISCGGGTGGGCNAEEIRCGESINSNTQFGRNTWERYNCSTGHSWEGPEKVYKVTTSNRGDLVATLTTSSSLDLDIFILSSCNPNNCRTRNINPAGNGSSVVRLNDAPPGDYYIVVDGQFSNTFGSFNLSVDCQNGPPPPPFGCQVEDDFEFYRSGDRVSSQNPNTWKKWSSSAIDGIVSTDRAASGRQSMEINKNQFGAQDVVLKLGNRSRGIYKVSWDMYINHGDVAYYNIQKNQNSLQPGGAFGGLRFVTSQWEGFWFKVELYFDLDRNRMKAFANNRELMNRSYTGNLGGINFFAVDDAHFYVDNTCLTEVSTFPLVSDPVSGSRSSESTGAESLGIEINPSITKETTTEILTKNRFATDELKVFPNPTQGLTNITIDLATEEEVVVTVVNQTGQLVKQTQMGLTQSINQQIDLSDLPNGMYLVRVDGNNFHKSHKILKQE